VGVTQLGWETRCGHGHYYTRSRKVKGRVVREYVGAGPIAEQASAADGRSRAERDADVELRRAARDSWIAADALLQQLSASLDVLTRAALLGAGFRQHNRGQWRRKRNGSGPGISAESAGSGPVRSANERGDGEGGTGDRTVGLADR